MSNKHPLPKIRDLISQSRRFVLDDKMSSFLGDLGWAAFTGNKDRLDVIDESRKLARLPHKITWIEWNEVELAKRVSTFYASSMNPKIVPLVSGVLLLQHPTIETAFRMFSAGRQHMIYDVTNRRWVEGDEHLGVSPFFLTWTTDDTTPPWPVYPGVDELGLRGNSLSEHLVGLPGYKSQSISVASSKEIVSYEGVPAVTLREMFNEYKSMLRYVLCLLATINSLPVSATHISQSKGFVARGRYRKFLDHSIITLHVPTERYRALARRTVSHLRRRAHQVRGHWRKDWRDPAGEKIWIKEHQRGDASLGFVLHDYVVKHEDGA